MKEIRPDHYKQTRRKNILDVIKRENCNGNFRKIIPI